MLPLARPLLDQIAIAAAAAAVVAFIVAVAAHVRVARLRRAFAVVDSPDGRKSVLDVVTRGVEETQQLRAELKQARADLDAARVELHDSLRHVSVVRYDAFGDMGGRLSFTAALLDDAGDGLLLTAIHGRSEARTYAKGVTSGRSEQSLSPEEEQAIELAMHGPKRR